MLSVYAATESFEPYDGDYNHKIKIHPYVLSRKGILKWYICDHFFVHLNDCLFICLFVWCFSPHSRIFHSYWDVTIAGEGLQILTYARHSWPLSSEGSLTSHTYCDRGNPFKMVISEELWHLHLLLSVYQWSCNYLFLRLRSVAARIRTI